MIQLRWLTWNVYIMLATSKISCRERERGDVPATVWEIVNLVGLFLISQRHRKQMTGLTEGTTKDISTAMSNIMSISSLKGEAETPTVVQISKTGEMIRSRYIPYAELR